MSIKNTFDKRAFIKKDIAKQKTQPSPAVLLPKNHFLP